MANAYAGKELAFGPDHLIPTPFDPRLILRSPRRGPGGARSPGGHPAHHRHGCLPQEQPPDALCLPDRHADAPGVQCRQVPADAAKVAYADGGRARAARRPDGDDDAHPILIGRPAVIEARGPAGLHGSRRQVCEGATRTTRAFASTGSITTSSKRDGATPEMVEGRRCCSNTIIASLMVKLGDADAMICGLVGNACETHLERIHHILGEPGRRQTLRGAERADDCQQPGTLFIADTCERRPHGRGAGDIAWAAVQEVQRFASRPGGIPVAPSFGSSSVPRHARCARRARDLFVARHPDIECDGELHGDNAALEPASATPTCCRDSTHRPSEPAGLPEHRRGQHSLQRKFQSHDQRWRWALCSWAPQRRPISSSAASAPRAEHDRPGRGQ